MLRVEGLFIDLVVQPKKTGAHRTVDVGVVEGLEVSFIDLCHMIQHVHCVKLFYPLWGVGYGWANLSVHELVSGRSPTRWGLLLYTCALYSVLLKSKPFMETGVAEKQQYQVVWWEGASISFCLPTCIFHISLRESNIQFTLHHICNGVPSNEVIVKGSIQTTHVDHRAPMLIPLCRVSNKGFLPHKLFKVRWDLLVPVQSHTIYPERLKWAFLI